MGEPGRVLYSIVNAGTPETDSRRKFLRTVGLGGGLVLGGVVLSGCGANGSSGSGSGGTNPGGLPPPPPPPPGPTTYTVLKLSTRKRHACKACKSHAQNMLFTTLGAVNANRAHAGCNCKVKYFVISDTDNAAWFGGGETVHDFRP